MKQLIGKIKKWWDNPCFWNHDYRIVATEQTAVAYECKKCSKSKIEIF